MKLSPGWVAVAAVLVSVASSQCAHRGHDVNSGSEETSFPVVKSLTETEGHFCNVKVLGTCLKYSTESILDADIEGQIQYEWLTDSTEICIKRSTCRPATQFTRSQKTAEWEQCSLESIRSCGRRGGGGQCVVNACPAVKSN